MHLIGPLITGMAGAESGTATLTARGTSSTVTWYSDFEGTDADSTGADINLDSNGRAEVYVNELVDVVVKNRDGVTLASFTAGGSVGAQELISASFTGTDYTSGSSAVSKPTTTQAAMDLWVTQNGAEDWKVLMPDGTTKKTIQSAMSGLAGIFYNVQDDTYGATGDGTTDDAAAIQAAIDAANTAGGGIVFFPEATYRIATALNLKADVSLWGVGPSSSIITIDSATADCVSTAGSTTREYQEIRGLYLKTSQANTAQALDINSATYLRVENCYIGGSDSNGDVIAVESDCRLIMVDCTVESGDVGASCLNSSSTPETFTDSCHFHRVNWVAASGTLTVAAVIAKSGSFIDCVFTGGPTAGDASTFFLANSGGGTEENRFMMLGNRFSPNAAATNITCYSLNNLSSAVAANDFWEDNTLWPGSGAGALYAYTEADHQTANPDWWLGTREHSALAVTDNSAALTLNALDYGIIVLTRTNATGQTITLEDAPPGASLRLGIHKDGANPTVGWSANTIGSSPGGATDTVEWFHMISIVVETTQKWYIIQTGTASAP